jgi:hypothetical protein
MPIHAFAVAITCTLLSFGLPVVQPAAGDGWIVLSGDLKAFQPPTGQWFIAGNARMDPKNEKRLVGEPGRGTLINGTNGNTHNLVTREKWSDVEVSLEFVISRGSNSGVKMEGQYEIQILDSWTVAKPTGADCGGIYPRAAVTPPYRYIDKGTPPRVNAAKAPGEWQSLQIRFRAPRFDKHGHKRANARFEKVVLNGKLIHENVEVAYPTGGYWQEKEHAVGPLYLQADHGPVAFRKVRLRPLPPVAADRDSSRR